MSILSTIFKAKRYIKTDNGYQLFSEWQKASEVEFNNGSDAETTLGAINGITSSLNTNNDNYALSAAGGYNLQSQVSKLNTNLSSIVIIKSVKIYAATTIAAGQGAEIYFQVPTVKGYKCILGIGGTCSNGYAIPVRASDVPKSDGTLRLFYRNISSGTITVNDLYCNMIFVRY